MPGDELASQAVASNAAGTRAGGRRAGLGPRRLPGPAGRWLSIFGASLGLFIIRLLVPAAVGQADPRDGLGLMCGRGLGVGPVVPRGDPRYFRYAYFEYAPSPSCAHLRTYPSSEVVPLELARVLTPVLRLPGTLNLIALAVLLSAGASIGIASLATGLRLRLWAQLLVAAILWLIMADAAFFDVYAGPFQRACRPDRLAAGRGGRRVPGAGAARRAPRHAPRLGRGAFRAPCRRGLPASAPP